MNNADQDERFRQMLEQFTSRLMTVHGLSLAEAQMVTEGELQRAYDERKRLRRSQFKVFRGDKLD